MSRTETLQLEGKAQPDQTKTYLMLPFMMPSDVVRVDVHYTYSAAIGSDPHLTGGNTIDIGIFDPRGKHFLGPGFRGWSGSARNAFYITTSDATPGYMPGPLQTGTWHICLGAYKVAEDGCDYQVTVQFTLGDATESELFPARLPLDAHPHSDNQHESGWYKGELHCHSYHSDGDSDPLDVVRRAESLDLDFLAITDHNVLSHQVTLANAVTRLMLIPGMEVTTYHGHWNIWGAGDWIDFRILSEADMQTAVNAALSQGYLVSCNHPRPFGPDWEYPAVEGFHCTEVWNGPWEIMNDVALDYWESRLKAGKRTAVVGGSDSHFHKQEHIAQLATPTTYIFCADTPSPAALLAGLRAGHAFISESPQGAQIYLSAGDIIMGDTITANTDALSFHLRVCNAVEKRLQLRTSQGLAHEFLIHHTEWEQCVELDIRQAAYVRAQVVSGDADDLRIHALTNPIYLQRSSL